MPDDSSSQPGFNYQDPVYLGARKEAFARSNGLCQFCGQQRAAQAHHWAGDYPPADETTADDLTALCDQCHLIATTLRRFTRAGGSRHQFCAAFSEAVAGVGGHEDATFNNRTVGLNNIYLRVIKSGCNCVNPQIRIREDAKIGQESNVTKCVSNEDHTFRASDPPQSSRISLEGTFIDAKRLGCGSSSLAAQSVSSAAARQEAIGSVKAW